MDRAHPLLTEGSRGHPVPHPVRLSPSCRPVLSLGRCLGALWVPSLPVYTAILWSKLRMPFPGHRANSVHGSCGKLEYPAHIPSSGAALIAPPCCLLQASCPARLPVVPPVWPVCTTANVGPSKLSSKPIVKAHPYAQDLVHASFSCMVSLISTWVLCLLWPSFHFLNLPAPASYCLVTRVWHLGCTCKAHSAQLSLASTHRSNPEGCLLPTEPNPQDQGIR